MARRDSAIVVTTGAIRRVVLALVLLAVLAVAVLAGRQYLVREPGLAAQIDRNTYQAVFLTGGQVFFGHATSGDEVIALSDVFYLTPNTDSSQPQQLGSLVKRGTELHGPREPMLIERRQVLFVENMRDDSQVVQAIKRFKSGEQPAAPQATAPSPTQAPSPTGTVRPSASR
ncbi:MAG TPA: hypothetical protein VIN34_01460 [Candidatus Limnocylindria bacterium]|jgi:hypothetical protein